MVPLMRPSMNQKLNVFVMCARSGDSCVRECA